MQESNTNGRVYPGTNSGVNTMNGIPVPDALVLKPTQATSRKVLLSIVPLTPAPITGPDAWIGWARLVVYGSLAAASWKRSRPVSVGFMAATGLSLMTSMAGEAYVSPMGRTGYPGGWTGPTQPAGI
jgi:hypothetical protein